MTFAHDISGLASVELKYRTDTDGKNPIADNANETYAGGAGVSSWTSVSMNQKEFPKDNIAQDAPPFNVGLEPLTTLRGGAGRPSAS